MLAELRPNSNIFAVARRGCGKTTIGKQFQELMHRKVIVDRNREYLSADGLYLENAIYAEGLQDFKDKLVICQDQDRYSLIFHFSPYENEDFVFDDICKWTYHAGDLTFVVEEVHHYCKPQFIPKWLKEIAASGRHKNIGYIFTSVSPSLINKLLFSLCDFYILGHLLNKNDRDYFRDQMGDDTIKLAYLKPREFYLYSTTLNESILIHSI
ncbi:MAG: hypothetical protein PHN88_16220 [Ignavibacteria bacterium]|nr:hypothetical protein [Ignavibacteria bacterium]